MWTAFPSSDYYADSDTPSAHRPTSSLPGVPPAARCARGVSHVHHDPFDRVGSRLYPYSLPDGRSQPPAGHHAQVSKPSMERAAIDKGGIITVDDPCPPGFGSFLQSGGFNHQIAFALPFGLVARARASGSAARPSHRRGRSTSTRDPAPQWSPSFTGPLHQPGSGIPAGTDEMFVVRHLLSHGAPWRTTYLQGIDTEEIISTVHARRAPMMHATAGLAL